MGGFFCRQDVSISIFGRTKEFSEVRGTSLMCNFGVRSRFLDVIYGVRPPNGSPDIHGHTLKETTQAKYLGVTIDNKLSWNSHVNQMTKRANQTTAFLRRNLSSCSKDVKAQCYKSLVRPQLEYAATTWDPYTKTNSAKVEAVKRRAARFCFNDYRQTSSVSSMMQDLGWEQLQTRRQQNKTVMMYLIVNNLVEIPANQYLTPTGVSTRGHQQRFLPYYCSVNAYQGSFFPQGFH